MYICFKSTFRLKWEFAILQKQIRLNPNNLIPLQTIPVSFGSDSSIILYLLATANKLPYYFVIILWNKKWTNLKQTRLFVSRSLEIIVQVNYETKVNRIFYVNLLFTIPPSCGRTIISYRSQNKRPNNELMFSVDGFMIFGDISFYFDANNFAENILNLLTLKFKFL